MSQTVGDFIVERLHAWGVRKIFGYPGDGIDGVIEALNRADGKIEFIQARHEEMAAFMASAYAKFSGELGVCLATSGPGASHLVTGLYNARLDHMPVLAIAGQQARNAIGGHYQQEVDLVSMYKDVAGAFVQQASSPAQDRSRGPHRDGRAARDGDHIAERPAGRALRGASAQARHGALGRWLLQAPHNAVRCGPSPRSRRPERRGEDRDPRRRGRARHDRRSDRRRRKTARRRRQGAARQGRPSG